MFTDGPVTPVRLEVLLDVLVEHSNGLKREAIYDLLQPSSLSGGGQNTARGTISAALQLGLAEDRQNIIKLTKDYDKNKSCKDNILSAADQKVLSSTEVEYYLALFFAYYLGQNNEVYQRSKSNFSSLETYRDNWVIAFNRDVYNNEPQTNPFNQTKHAHFDHWLSYLGLGWYDSNDDFQANPYERLYRALPTIFGGKSTLKDHQFMGQLAQVCPELDGGKIFLQANKYRGYNPEDKQCTLGLSHALVDLHEDEVIRLDCPVDSRGWNIGASQPSRDDTIKSDRITLIEFLGN